MINRFQAGIRIWLLGLAVLSSLPLFLFAAYSAYLFGETKQEEIIASLFQRTEATASAVNQRLSLLKGYLNGLATSDAARRNDLAELFAHAKRLIEASPEAVAVTLVAPDNRLVFFTLRPFGGTEGMVASDQESVRRVFETGKPVASGPFKSPINDRIVAAIGVPIFQDGKVVYCIRMIIRTESLNELLASQNLPTDWISRIVDRNGVLLARSHSADLFVGKGMSSAVVNALLAGTQGVFDSVTRDGIPSQYLIVKVPSWDWSVVISVPNTSLYKSLNRSLDLLIAIGLATILIVIAAAFWLSRFIAQQVAIVASASVAANRGEKPPVSDLPIRELGNMTQAIGAIAKREERTRLALRNITARHEETISELESAKRDSLTGLPTRVLFLEMTTGLRDGFAAHSGRTLALLFIDLDGFKEVNDTFGHEQGDKVLVRTAEILRALTRESDTAGRLGGDEFVVCLTADEENLEATAISVATRVVDSVREIGFGIGCSVGISLWSGQCPDVSCAIRRADEAMYEAKRRGKNCFVIFGHVPKTDGSAWAVITPPMCNVACIA